jgi:phosphoribosyl 1,2-cyclic phosphodiesterase
MSIYFTALNSGSNGNCYYIGNDDDAILIDAGLSCKEIEKRLQLVNLSIQKVRAIFISHEHIDHIKGVELLSKRYHLPVYITELTLQNSRFRVPKSNTKILQNNQSITIGGLVVTAFTKSHDAADPTSFTIVYNQKKVGVFTDIGHVCDNVIFHFKQCHAAFLEANYDDEMLENGPYPFHLKNRIRGDKGHLSNLQALELFTNHRHEALSHLLLSHLSKENNNPEMAQSLFQKNTVNTEIFIASRHEPTPVLFI